VTTDKPQIRVWKLIEPPFLPFCILLAEFTIIPVAFGGWTVAANITTIFAVAMAFIVWYVVRSLVYKKHERVIVTWELECLTASIKAREQFLATGKWPDPDQAKQIESEARDIVLLRKWANMDPAEEMKKIFVDVPKKNPGEE
jgi:hypothetical protein